MSATRTRDPRGHDPGPDGGPNAAEPTIERASATTSLAEAGILLPPEWIRDRGLTVGGPLEVEELPDGSLLLRPAIEAARPATFTVPASSDRSGEHLFRELVAAYLGGATTFTIVEPGGLRPETRQVALAFAERTGTPRIVSEDTEVLVLEERSDGTAAPLPELLRRMYRTVREIQESAGGFLDGTGGADPSRLIARDDEVDRQAWLVERTLVHRLDRDPTVAPERTARPDPISPILIARALERTADHAVVLGEHAARLSECSIPASVRSSLRTYHRQALEYLDSAFAVTEAPDVRRANELLDTGAALHAAHRSLTESFLVHGTASDLSPLASADLGLVLQSIDRTVAYSEDLVEVGLDRAVATQLAQDPGGELEPAPTSSKKRRPRVAAKGRVAPAA
ncbi:MAG TPA: PhoU domain-containing protein [Thermoplasmata archaeon]|nr:PhoU domain-containing protein [Thermoplasmata archaeon]